MGGGFAGFPLGIQLITRGCRRLIWAEGTRALGDVRKDVYEDAYENACKDARCAEEAQGEKGVPSTRVLSRVTRNV